MSNATQPSESDFHDSHPVSNAATDPKTKEATQSIGDLTSIENENDTPSSHNIDLTSIDESQSEILGDISLLDEAFAEMEDTSLPADALNDTTHSKTAIETNTEAADESSNSKNTASKIASEIVATSDTEIPVLNESIETPNESKIISPETMAASVPLLNEEATAFAEMLKPASTQTEAVNTEAANSQAVNSTAVTSEPVVSTAAIPEANTTEHIISEPASVPETPDSKIISEISNDVKTETLNTSKTTSEALFDSVDAQSNANINELNDSLAMAAEMLSESVPSGLLSEFSADETASEEKNASNEDSDLIPDLNDAALEALLTEDEAFQSEVKSKIESEIEDEIISPQVTSIISEKADDNENILSEFSMGTTSIDEKITLASSHSEFEINEQPLGALSEPSEFPSNFAEDLLGSQSSTFSNSSLNADPEMNSDLNSMDISEFNPEVDLKSETQASHTVGITGQGQTQNNLNISIPFELHSQLSQKIDELVIDATSSITEELHTQLTSRLDTLLGNAVESVLPKLVNQMASELRNEINDKVKQQLPNIINDVLNKTRLQK